MVRVASASPAPDWHAGFLAMLPIIRSYARGAFRHLAPEARQDMVQEVIANSLTAYVRLLQRGRIALAYPTVLAKYGIAQVNDGRRVGTSLNINEVLSPYAQQRKHFKVESIDHFDDEENQWREAVVQDSRSAPVPDVVSFRVDFADWLASLTRRNRKIAQYLALGHRTGDAARKFGVSDGRISQLRRELAESWRRFVGDEPPAAAACRTA